MNSSRKDGLLCFDIKQPYSVSIDGTKEERTEIICHEMDSKGACNIAFDLDQLLTAAFSVIQRKIDESQTKTKKQLEEEKEEKNFYENDSPTEKEIKTVADQLLFMFKMQKEVKLSEVIDLFDDLVGEKILHTAGDVKLTPSVWETIKSKERLDITFRYIAFFANPLQSLLAISTTESKGK